MKTTFFFLLVIFFQIGDLFSQTIVSAADFGVVPGKADCTKELLAALKACRKVEDAILTFENDTYYFKGDLAVEKYMFISNNDEGLKRIIFPIFNMDDLVIDGRGAQFVFSGFVNPFVIDSSRNITLTNFSIDFDRPFHSEAVIIADHDDGMEVEILENFPYRISEGMLEFIGNKKEKGLLPTVSEELVFGYGSLLEYDAGKRETAYRAQDYYLKTDMLAAKDLGNRRVMIFHSQLTGIPGNILTFAPSHRKYPGFVVSDCRDINFKNVTIYHSGGMGIIGQRTHNIAVDRCKVTPAEGRVISTTADATHFVNCTGNITLSNNLFENQKDDATNIHGIYAQIVERSSPDELIVALKHKQQHGFVFLYPGVEVEFVNDLSLITYDSAIVKEAEQINKQYTRVKFDRELSEKLVPGHAVAEIRDYPNVHIYKNVVRRNRARGMLLNCRGKTVVEENYFHSPGAAILFEGDAHFWFEQGGVRDCVIRNNIFDNCLYGVWGKAVIDVKAGIHQNFDESRYNRNILIENNTFKVFDKDTSLLNVYCVDGLVWKNNSIEKTAAYPSEKTETEQFIIQHSDDVVLDK